MQAQKLKQLQAKIALLVKSATTNPSKIKESIVINKLTQAECQLIKNKTGLTLNGYYRVIDNFGIRHTLKNLGDINKEAERGQIAVVENDFEKIPLILQTDNIVFRGKNRSGTDVLLYEATIGNKYYYAEEVRTKQKHLVLNSMWKRKK